MNRCKCASPPGGTVECEPGQLAICEVQKDGSVRAGCLPLPSSVSLNDRLAVANWALGIVTGTRRELRQELSTADRQILEASFYVEPKFGRRISFSLPRPATEADGGRVW